MQLDRLQWPLDLSYPNNERTASTMLRSSSETEHLRGFNVVSSERQDHAIVLFDGVCNLCNATVNFLIDHDPNGKFRFGALQAEAVEPLLERYGLQPANLETFVLIDDGRVYGRSDAALRIAWRLGGAWRLLYPLLLLPRPLRDAVYDWIAANRYRWFGKRQACRIPAPELKDRFIT